MQNNMRHLILLKGKVNSSEIVFKLAIQDLHFQVMTKF